MASVNVNPPHLSHQYIERFWSYVDKTIGHGPNGDCWRWTKGTHGIYGAFSISEGRRKYRSLSAHRVAFFLSYNTWPSMNVCHRCDWPLCCNPGHLFEGSHVDNRNDATKKKRHAFGSRVGTSKLTPEDVLEVRRLRAAGHSNKDVAQQFGIDRSHVSHIVNNDWWKHLS